MKASTRDSFQHGDSGFTEEEEGGEEKYDDEVRGIIVSGFSRGAIEAHSYVRLSVYG